VKTVAYLSTEDPNNDPVWRAAQEAVQELGAVLTRLDDFLAAEFTYPELSRNLLWTFVSEADVVLSHVTSFSPRMWYEIGVAVGLRKRLILMSNDPLLTPFDLSEAVVSYEGGRGSEERLRFKIEQLLQDHLRNRPRNVGTAWTRYRWDSSRQLPPFDFRSGHGPMATGFARRFEQWITDIFHSVSEWEAITGKGSDQAYDVVFWNEIPDSDLASLGNPIVVEAKAGKLLTKATIQQVAERAEKQGLKGFILTTTAQASEAVRKHVLDVASASGLTIVVLDRDDLARIREPKDLVSAIKKRLIDLRRSSIG
jgi:hypothetical protein